MRVFLDTNILVSAFVSRGLCTDLLKTVLGEHDLLVSFLVAEEFGHVLRDRLRTPETVLERAPNVFDHVEVVSNPKAVPGNFGFDGDDASILAAAIQAEADVFVSGDQELLEAAKQMPIPAVSPRRFMELIRTPGDSSKNRPDGDDESRASEGSLAATREKAFEFSQSIIALCKTLEERREDVLARQLLRAGTSIGASLEGADVTLSRKEFAQRMAMASKEAHETNYWLRLLSQSGIAHDIHLEPYAEKCLELIRLLAAAATTTTR